MRRCQICSGAHNLAIAARLASFDALPDSTMLAASTGCCGRSTRKLARRSLGYGGLRQSARFDPAASPMLGAGQREIQTLNLKNCFQATFYGAS
jgi:hypothetical protein